MTHKPPHLVVLTGAGISAESGIQTFRAHDGLWADHRIEDVATPEAWTRDPARVLSFYDARRDQVRAARPNAAHRALANLEARGFEVNIITQNIDDLHERAGSRNVLHLHGEIMMARSSVNPRMRYPLGRDNIAIGDVCDQGSQLRPDVVWFGEAVPAYPEACEIVAEADLLLVVGTSLAVMPAAALVNELSLDAECILVDPDEQLQAPPGVVRWVTAAGEGVPALVRQWQRDARLFVPPMP
ncbi:SIR2 family NAD-dependent protein deacylase [Halomonas huangheensis]|uniref:NAD-dependent protein deacylase n=1 Tax=Halomonas huangheensis TaxID=1178482 RepID=W1N920_9GAMM|nr:Sir2 family NAD-dependent protein deacetylase [Halomonas huangheensis]ALM53689.1 NAD-dependent deacylase [Halomonas huangheensis]ERL52013.1 hypothetical protein BJB45_10570 [Halomonas huangheensis]